MLDHLGNVGDFVGGIAVVVSLFYLAFQIRRNTLSVQAAMIQSAAQAHTEIVEMMARDPEVLRLFYAGTHGFEALSDPDRLRFSLLMGSVLHRFENMVAQTERGLLPIDSWEGAANRLRGTFALPGTREWWARGKHVFNAQLQRWVDREMIDEPPGTQL